MKRKLQTAKESDTKGLQEQQNQLIDQIVSKFTGVTADHGQIKKDVLKLVELCRESVLRHGQQESLQFISMWITRALKAKGLTKGQIEYVSDVIPDQYKVLYQRTSQSAEHLAIVGLNVSEECSIEHGRLLETVSSLHKPDLRMLNHEKIATIYNKICDLKAFWDEIALDAEIAVDDNEDYNQLDANEKSAKSKFPNKITLGSGAPTKPEHEKFAKLAHDNWKLISDMIGIIDKDLDKYSPQSFDSWVQYINAQVSWIVMAKPVTDKKWQRTWLGWIDILKDYKSGGGTFASGRSLVATGEVELKTGKGIMRAITKEQIDATYVAKLNHMSFVCKNIPFFFDMFQNVNFTQLKLRALRAVKLAPKLEHSA